MYIWGMEAMMEKNFMEWRKQKEFLAGTLTPVGATAKTDEVLTTKAFHEATK